jgi:hypothetical protein
MKISITNSFTHEPCAMGMKMNDESIKNIVLDSCNKIGFDSDQIKISEDGIINLQKPNNLSLHTLLLKLEEHGLNLKMTKQTLIEVI